MAQASRAGRLCTSRPGSSNRVVRAMLLDMPPSLDVGEATDKGSINQRMVLKHRTTLVDQLYAETPPPRVIAIKDKLLIENTDAKH